MPYAHSTHTNIIVRHALNIRAICQGMSWGFGSVIYRLQNADIAHRCENNERNHLFLNPLFDSPYSH